MTLNERLLILNFMVRPIVSGVVSAAGAVFLAAIAIFLLLVFYGVGVLVFRYAYGVDLPNPFNLLPAAWR